MRILITGGSGMLGSDVVPILESEFEVYSPKREELDIKNFEQIRQSILGGGYDWVVHLAALTDLDWCEDNPQEAFLVNAEATRNIAEACRDSRSKLLYISTSGVFCGTKRSPYTEEDIPSPVNVYGRSKYLGEQYVKDTLPEERHLILRIGWLFGGGHKDKKFVRKMFDLLRERPEVMAVEDIVGSPHYSVDIGRTIVEMIKGDFSGIFHVGNSGEPASRYDIAVAIRDLMGVAAEVVPVSANRFPTRAFRPPMEAISVEKAENALGHKLRHWREALAEYIERLKRLS